MFEQKELPEDAVRDRVHDQEDKVYSMSKMQVGKHAVSPLLKKLGLVNMKGQMACIM